MLKFTLSNQTAHRTNPQNFAVLEQTISMGIRALIISNLSSDKKEKFEDIVRYGADDDLVLFGYQNIPMFKAKMEKLLTTIYSAYKNT